ncbi:hypothetical protein DM860_012296 [Cuscuta australis]|uniref:Reverse transcriptase zinc-binding domain-containing protein n=1 Tax=Cuscuta australis TaxID=267555 RepID=A0A328DU84_9ASTE|nr:hypothetical protein DM860_012296 [Cuscuta australis]
MSFFGWRLLVRKLPPDSTLQKFGYVLPSKCSCCTKPTCETTEHVFAQSEVAKTVWKYFCGLFGLNEQGISTVKQYFNVWWGAKSHPKKYTVRILLKRCMSIFILWELWVHYTSVKYGEKQINIDYF